MRKDIEISRIEALVSGAGLTFFGLAALAPEDEFGRFRAWIDLGRHAGMTYLEDHLALRADPRGLLAGAKSAVIVGLNYYLGDRQRSVTDDAVPRVAQYARLKDYHKLLWRKGELILDGLKREFGAETVGRVVVDSAPVLERALAARGGRGFIGKNTCFIDAERGSFFLLAEILTTIELPIAEVDPVDPTQRGERGGCGTCKRCQVHCPTGALAKDYSLDANLCLAYWTIENRGEIPEKFWPWLKQYVFGCDICQLVCPYNRGAELQKDAELVKLREPPALFDVATMDARIYERLFGGTPMTRAKREGLIRNALIAMTVTKDARLDEALRLVDGRETAPVLKGTLAQIAKWRASPAQPSN